MARRSYESLGTLQRAVMDILWREGEITVQRARELVDPRGELAYTTVLSVMQKLERLGWVRHRTARGARAYLYSAVRSREQSDAGVLRGIVDRVFRGDPLLLFQRLIAEDTLSDRELEELRRMIDARRKERRP